MRSLVARLALILLTFTPALWADKVIMKDGKIYEGRVMGETPNSVLISNPPIDPKPRFIELKDVMTIVRESRPKNEHPTDDRRFVSLHGGTRLQTYSSDEFSFAPAAALYGGGAFRLHPMLDLGGEIVLTPHLSHGGLTVTNGTDARQYERFYAFQGGFFAKVYPFYRSDWRVEPYVVSGFSWTRLVPKGSDDLLKGRTFSGGIGAMVPWWKPLYWDFRFLYEHTDFTRIEFLTDQGDLTGVTLDTFALTAGLSWRFL